MFARSRSFSLVVIALLLAPRAEAARRECGTPKAESSVPASTSSLGPSAKDRARSAAMYARALKLFDAGRVIDARRLVETSLDLDPTHPGATLLAGSIAQTYGRNDEAIAHYKRFLSYAPRGSQLEEVTAVLSRLLRTTSDNVLAVVQ
ncbi:MAG: hypothetical protein JNG84_14305 [Archangium sp.]|nr:hypothetical protein [Archangium sp.]